MLKSRVDNYFKENNIVSAHSKLEILMVYRFYDTQDPKIDYWMFLRYIVLFIVANLGWFGVVSPYGIGISWESV